MHSTPLDRELITSAHLIQDPKQIRIIYGAQGIIVYSKGSLYEAIIPEVGYIHS